MQLLWYIWHVLFWDSVFRGIWDSLNMAFQLFVCDCMKVRLYSICGCTCVCVCVCVCVCLVPKAEWCPCWFCSSSSLSCSTQCVCLLGRLAAFSSVPPQRPSLLWGVKNFHLCISLDKKAPSPFESSSNTGRHCGHASLALISQILKPVCGEQDLRG